MSLNYDKEIIEVLLKVRPGEFLTGGGKYCLVTGRIHQLVTTSIDRMLKSGHLLKVGGQLTVTKLGRAFVGITEGEGS